MNVLFDTNVVLDVLLARAPHAEAAARLFSLVDSGRLEGTVCATTVTTVFYLASKAVGGKEARRLVADLLSLFSVAAVGRPELEIALGLSFDDFEDAVLHEAARSAGMTAIVTRNGRDFTRATLPIFAPQELLAALGAARL